MHVSVIVVNWRRPDLTRRCLTSLIVATRGLSLDVEIVLVENEAPAGAAACWREEFPDVVVVELPGNEGFAGGVRRGWERTVGEVVVLVNNDAVVAGDFLSAGLAVLRSSPLAGAVAATVVLEGRFRPARPEDAPASVLRGTDGSLWHRSAGDDGVLLLNGTGVDVDGEGNGYDRDWLAVLPPRAPEHDRQPFGFSGGAAFLRRAAVEDRGGFDASLFMYYEDLDLSWRLRLGGWEVVHAPAARTVHVHAGSSSSSSDLVRYQSMRNRLAVVVRNGSPALVGRVVLRTVGRAARDIVAPGPERRLRLSDWSRLAREFPAIAWRSWRARRGDAVRAVDRRRVEGTFRRPSS